MHLQRWFLMRILLLLSIWCLLRRRCIPTFFFILKRMTMAFTSRSSGLILQEILWLGFRTFGMKSVSPLQTLCPSNAMVGIITKSFWRRIHDQDQNGQQSLRVRSFWVLYAGLSIGSLSVYHYVSINCLPMHTHISHPQGRDPDYRSLNEQFTLDVVNAASTLNLFPISFRQWVILHPCAKLT